MKKTQKGNKERNTKLSFIRPRVLIVEDCNVAQTAIKEMVLSLGCEVDVADTGNEAIEMYKGNYDLIFLDIYLPDVTGLGVYMAIRSQESSRHIPIIAITVDETKKEECLAIGFDEFITKPLMGEKCEKILKRWLKNINFDLENDADPAFAKSDNKNNKTIKN